MNTCLFLRFEDLFAVNDGGDEIGLCDLLDVIVQEIAVIDRHVGEFTKLDGTHAMLLTELTGHIDGHGTQRLLAGDGFLGIAARVSWHDELRIATLFCSVDAEPLSASS